MSTRPELQPNVTREAANTDPRAALLSGLPLTERRIELAGISTALLEGGEGPSIILLHGPGAFAASWLRVLPDLVETHHVVAPDLPGHGASTGGDRPLNVENVLAWLGALIDETFDTRPTVVGHVLGGAIAARFVIEHEDSVERLVLVDSLGLAAFRPSLWFALSMMGFLLYPTEGSYHRFMRQCSYDLPSLREEMGDRWEPFVAYNLDRAQAPNGSVARDLMRTVGIFRIPSEDLEQIDVPTALIWGRHDRALRLHIAEEASERYGWPLHVIEDSADDPPLDQPEAFLSALRSVMEGTP